MDPSQIAGLGFVGSGALLALVATLRYVKHTEDDTVDNLRIEIDRLRADLDAARVFHGRQTRQIDMLVKIMRQNGIEIPDEFWTI